MCKFSPLFSKLLNLLVFQSPHTYLPKKREKEPKSPKVCIIHLDKTMVANYMTTWKNSSQFLNHKIMAQQAKLYTTTLYTPHSLRLKMVVKVYQCFVQMVAPLDLKVWKVQKGVLFGKKMSPSRHIMKKKNIKKSPHLENRSQV